MPKLWYEDKVKMNLLEILYDGELWTGLFWLRIGTNSGHLGTW